MARGAVKRPVQIYLRPEQIGGLRALAARRGVSVAELVRQGVDHILTDVPPEEDPLWQIVGMCDVEPADLATRHDDYLAELVERENR